MSFLLSHGSFIQHSLTVYTIETARTKVKPPRKVAAIYSGTRDTPGPIRSLARIFVFSSQEAFAPTDRSVSTCTGYRGSMICSTQTLIASAEIGIQMTGQSKMWKKSCLAMIFPYSHFSMKNDH